MARTLRRGHSGDDVRTLQQQLHAAGFDPGAIDGIFGPATERAVRAFQQSRGLDADGIAGPLTQRALADGGGGGPAPGQSRGRSLHIGINVVDANAYPMHVPDLAGCENDARDMLRIAGAQGFTGSMMLSPAATSGAVVAAITDAARTLRGGDFFFVTYSGHGSQMPDSDGEEPDGYDETWVLYDRQLLDDELAALWTLFQPGVRIFVLSDSCHSGTVVREIKTRDAVPTDEIRAAVAQYIPDASDAVYRTLVKHLGAAKARDVAAPVPRGLSVEAQRIDAWERASLYRSVKRAAREMRTKALSSGPSVLLISGCQDDQVSLDGARNGLFTQKLLEVWAAGGGTDYADLHRRILQRMPAHQTPNLAWGSDYDQAFERERPLTIAGPRSRGVVKAKSGSGMT